MAVEAAPGLLHRLAPAKVNLTLHLRGRRADGYHLLDSLVVFPRIGDRVTVRPAPRLSLEVSGPFAQGLPGEGLPGERLPGQELPGQGESAGADNLVLRAARDLAAHHSRAPSVALYLEKNLPVAAGLGGGSSDAAAVLALLAELWGVRVPRSLALALGADVPVCQRAPEPTRMQGIGEHLAPAPPLPEFWLVLVNPGVAVPTGAVFAAIGDRNPPAPPEPPATGLAGFRDLVSWLGSQRNDLQAPAARLCPAITEVLAALSSAPLARMSGSGATCFALLPDRGEAKALAADLRRSRPSWWIAAAPVGPETSGG